MRFHPSIPEATRQAVASAAELRTTEKVVAWAAARGGDIVDIVVQDEFTHDVIVAVGSVFLVFDTT